MRHLLNVFVLAGILMVPSMASALTVGDKAPPFDAESTEGTISLENYLGKQNVVLALYYADFTPV
jgi:peroxiredoxin